MIGVMSSLMLNLPSRAEPRNEDGSSQVRQVQEAQLYLQPSTNEVGRRTDDHVCPLQRMRQPVEVLLKLPLQIFFWEANPSARTSCHFQRPISLSSTYLRRKERERKKSFSVFC